jgi:hypothetical protein
MKFTCTYSQKKKELHVHVPYIHIYKIRNLPTLNVFKILVQSPFISALELRPNPKSRSYLYH